MRTIGGFIVIAILAGGLGFQLGRTNKRNVTQPPIDAEAASDGPLQPDTATASPQINSLPKNSGSAEASLSPVAPKTQGNGALCEQGASLQDQLARMKFVELRRFCDEAEDDWRKRNLETRAPGPRDGVESDKYRAGVLDSLREVLLQTAYFRGETSFTVGNRNIRVDVLLNFYNGKESPDIQAKRKGLGVTDPMNFCYVIAPVFIVNDKLSQQSTSSMSSCGATLQKRGDRYYFPWNLAGDKDIAPAISLMLIPIPGASGTGLEYLDSDTGEWLTQNDFQWRASSQNEFDSLQKDYRKRLEEGSR